MKVAVIQYMRPDGRQVAQETELDDSLAANYERMKARGCNLAAEVLNDWPKSRQPSKIATKKKTFDIQIVANGPAVQAAYEHMLRKYFS